MVPSRHRLHHIPQQRQHWHPLARHPPSLHPNRLRPHPLLPQIRQHPLLLRRGQRVPGQVLRSLPEMAHDERRGPDDQFRAGLGLVLLDLGHRGRGPVELEGRHGGWRAPETDVGERFQLHDRRAGFWRFKRELLTASRRPGFWDFGGVWEGFIAFGKGVVGFFFLCISDLVFKGIF